MDTTAILVVAGLWFGPGIIGAIFWLIREQRFRAKAPALIRSAASMSDSQLKGLTEDQFELYKEAVEYGLSYKSGALADDPKMFALERRFAAEYERRLSLFIAEDIEERRLEREAAAASARRELGL